MNPQLQKILMLPAYVRALILAVILSLVGAGFYFTLYQQQMVTYEEETKTNQRLEKDLARKLEYARNLPKYQAQFEALKNELDQSVKELPKEKEIPTLLTSIAGLAKKQGLEVLLFQPQNEVLKGFYAEVPVSLKLSGDFHQVAMFFDSVGKMDRIVNVGDLSVKKGGSASKGGLGIDCRVVTFRFVENPPPQQNSKKGRR